MGRLVALAVGCGLAAACGLWLIGCGFVPTIGSEGPRLYDPTYRAALQRFTRHQSLYQGLERRLIWAATMESQSFRELKAEAFASIQRLSEPELATLRMQEGREAEAFLDFFVGFFTERLAWNNLDEPGSMWRTDLLIDGEILLLPVEIKEVLEPNPNVRALYPFLGHFSRAYRVRFLRKDVEGVPLVPPQAKVLTLRVSSAVAHGELTWPTSLLLEETGPTPAGGSHEPVR